VRAGVNSVVGWRCRVRTTEDGNWPGEKGHKKGHKNVPFWVLDGLAKISASALEKAGGDDETRTRDLCRDSGRIKGN
jgi:hypothetical protein